MQLQDLSFKLPTDHISLDDGVTLSVEVFSFHNLYYPKDHSYQKEGNKYVSKQVIWGGSEPTKEGFVSLEVNENDGVYSFDLEAKLDEKVRETKLKFENLPLGNLISAINGEHVTNERGEVLFYPEAWRGIVTPLLVFKISENRYLYFRSLDYKVRQKRFFIKKTSENTMMVELLFEESGKDMTNSVKVPTWEYGYVSNKEDIYKKHLSFLEKIYHYERYEDRKDVPNWFRDVSLIVICHMQHWTGHIFHTYQEALNDFKELAKYIDPKRILFYIPGWEGRYYYKYGNFTADERMGGERELKKFVDGVHELGGHVLSMVSLTIANKELPDYEKWGKDSEFVICSGSSFKHGSVDWDGSRHYDHNTNAQLNPAAPGWQKKIIEEISRSTLDYGFDGIFLDISACYHNDLRYEIAKGVFDVCNALNKKFKDFLIAGECLYDGIMMAMPLYQCGHTDGLMHYHDSTYEDMFSNYAREFAHLCLGDFSRGSTGTHELGTNSTDVKAPYRRGIIPTLCLVKETIKDSLPEVKEVIEDAKRYAKEYL